MHLMKNFQKEGGAGKVLKFVTSDGSLRKKCKKFLLFCKHNSILRPFKVKFRLEPFRAAQNVHKISIKKIGGHMLD